MVQRGSTKPNGTVATIVDLIRTRREGTDGYQSRQRARLHELVRYARLHSPFYRRFYTGVPTGDTDLAVLPPVTKAQLMAAFDDWVCDPEVTLADIREFISDPHLIGTPYRHEYFVCTSSGTTGRPGVYLHDQGACRVYQAMSYPMDMAWLSRRKWLSLLHRHVSWAVVVGTSGHFAGVGWIRYLSRRHWWRRNWRAFSLQTPLPQLVADLNDFQPAILTSYPSALDILASEQRTGRLRIDPVIVELGGESFDTDRRSRITAAFGEDVVHDSYSASECLVMAFDCPEGWLHVNADWVILEPVEVDYTPTPRGHRSHTVLLTNLANRVQPIIRYDLGDSITERQDGCPCGNPLPAIRVEGRSDDVLHLTDQAERDVALPPLGVGAVLQQTPGVHLSQLVQTSPRAVTVRLEISAGAGTEQVWSDVLTRLAGYFADQGLLDIDITRSSEPPLHDIASGKFRHVIAGHHESAV